jgi:fructose-specific phosphotransferase system IIC component
VINSRQEEAVLMEWLKKAPTAVTVTVILVCGLLALSIVGAYVVLTINGADTTEFRQWVQTIGQLLVYPLLGTTAVASVAAARSSSKAEDNTNGNLTALQNEVRELREQIARAPRV